MKRYADSLAEGVNGNGIEATIWYPTVFFAKCFGQTNSGVGKWLGYLDKWLLFPLILKWRLYRGNHKNTFFHICDHSNSPYLSVLPKKRTGITCHDVLAIRGALGYKDAYCSASPMGKILQKWILEHLKNAHILTTVSQFTMGQLLELVGKDVSKQKRWKVIYNTFNGDFKPIAQEEVKQTIEKYGLLPSKYLLHIGSSLPRKNRRMLLEMVALLGEEWEGKICFAGQIIDEALKQEIKKLGLGQRVVSIVKPGHATLLALYSGCEAFVFPSFSEGFGWPVIEAQACGVPVVASDIEPMPEVSGGAALHASPYSALAFANAFIDIREPNKRQSMIQKGFENCKRFDKQHIIQQFLSLYQN